MMKVFAAAVLMLLAVAPALAKDLPRMADKALYCSAVYYAAADAISTDGDPGAARVIRMYAKEWLSMAYGVAGGGGFNRREVNAIKPKYEPEAKADVAAKRYRYTDCSSYGNAN